MKEGIRRSENECYELHSPAYWKPIIQWKEKIKLLNTVSLTMIISFKTVKTDVNGDNNSSGF
tara:strand:+ start:814 stop:999 length:186 start_codon:yes stop_codon:yes gene_type:complete